MLWLKIPALVTTNTTENCPEASKKTSIRLISQMWLDMSEGRVKTLDVDAMNTTEDVHTPCQKYSVYVATSTGENCLQNLVKNTRFCHHNHGWKCANVRQKYQFLLL